MPSLNDLKVAFYRSMMGLSSGSLVDAETAYYTTGGSPNRDLLTVGEGTINRFVGTITDNQANPATQAVNLTYWTAQRTETVNNVAMMTGGIAAAATPTLCRMGVYKENADLSLTLVGACANDTTLFAATFTRYQRALTSSFTKVLGQRYAFANLIVSAVAIPSFEGLNHQNATPIWNILGTAPRTSAVVAGQNDLPATIASGSLANSPKVYWGEVLP